MAADALTKAISANNIRYGDSVVATGAKRGVSATKINTTTGRGIVYSSIETNFYNILDRRFDDTTYYTA